MANQIKNLEDRKYDREAEKSIISCMLQTQEIIGPVAASLSGDEFSADIFKKIFDAIVSINNKGDVVNTIKLRDYLIKKGESGDITDIQFLNDILLYVPNPIQYKSFIEIVKEKYLLRRGMQACNSINKDFIDSDKKISTILNEAQDKFFNLSKEDEQKDYVKYTDIIPNVMIDIGNVAKSPDGITGVKTKYSKLDQWTAGFQKSDLIILAARPSVGKTAFALNLAYNMMKCGNKVLFFSLEMSKEQLMMRLMSMESRLSSEKLRSGRLSEPDMQNLITSVGLMSDKDHISGDLHIDDTSSITIAELKNKCKKLKSDKGLDVVFIDYLQLMHAGNVAKDSDFAKYINNRQEEVAEISRSLKGLAKDLQIPVVALAQTRRPSDTSDKKDIRPQLEDLKESGAIEQDADIVMFLHRPKKDSPDVGDVEEMQLIIAKHRNGRTGTLSFRFEKSITKFDEFEKSDSYIVPPSTKKSDENNS